MIAESLELKLPGPNGPPRLLLGESEGSNLRRLGEAGASSHERRILQSGQRDHAGDPRAAWTDPLGLRRGWTEEEAGGGSFPTRVPCRDTEDLLTPATGLDEEELGLPSQAGAAAPIEDVHDFLDGHRTPICAIHSAWELAVAGLGDQEAWLQNQEVGVGFQHTVQRLREGRAFRRPQPGAPRLI